MEGAAEFDEAQGDPLPKVWRLGGKGGTASHQRVAEAPAVLGGPSDALIKEIRRSEGRLRWVLATPARFRRGWIPDFLNEDGSGIWPDTDIAVRLVSAAVGRAVAYSGWNMQAKQHRRGGGDGAPRPTRLLVPAGSVYFFEVVGGGESAEALAKRWWLRSVCSETIVGESPEDHIDRASGLGAGMFGPWDWAVGDDRRHG